MAENETTTVCRSVFKSGGSTTTKEAFTKMWTELINTLEKKTGTIEFSYDTINAKTARSCL